MIRRKVQQSRSKKKQKVRVKDQMIEQEHGAGENLTLCFSKCLTQFHNKKKMSVRERELNQ